MWKDPTLHDAISSLIFICWARKIGNTLSGSHLELAAEVSEGTAAMSLIPEKGEASRCDQGGRKLLRAGRKQGEREPSMSDHSALTRFWTPSFLLRADVHLKD